MKCKDHPRYAATRKPVKTMRFPDGCPTCWGVWEDAKTSAKRRVPTVTIELDANEARVMAHVLGRLRPNDPTGAILKLYTMLTNAV